MWWLKRFKAASFTGERQENTNNLQFWKKVLPKQLNNFPVTLETQFTSSACHGSRPPYHGAPAWQNPRRHTPPLPHATIATRRRPSIAAAAVHHQQRGIASRTVLPSSEESPRQARREVTVPRELCHLPGMTPPLIPALTTPNPHGLRHGNRSQVTT